VSRDLIMWLARMILSSSPMNAKLAAKLE